MKTTLEPASAGHFGPNDLVVLGLDAGSDRRVYFVGTSAALGSRQQAAGADWTECTVRDVVSKHTARLFENHQGDSVRVHVILYPTRTFQMGMGGGMFSELAPEDRSVIRRLQKRFPGRVDAFTVPLQNAGIFAELPGYIANEGERAQFDKERSAPLPTREEKAKAEQNPAKRSLIQLDLSVLKKAGWAFKSSMTKPNGQDFFYLVTKTFGLNLFIRLVFTIPEVRAGRLALNTAVISMAWYQLQDAVFTIFGQTYMKFLGKMTGLFRIRNAYLGDFLFVYVQLSFFEFLNRLILGPLGQNPLVFTWAGIGLILLNNLQGMASGGPLIPAINKMRKAGVISHSTMMHFYQISSLAMYFGLFATFGHQTIYTILTLTVMAGAWGIYVLFSVLYRDTTLPVLENAETQKTLDAAMVHCYLLTRKKTGGATGIEAAPQKA